jgi:hypothetical protein
MNDWILTSQGVDFDVGDPQPQQVRAMDIAWALSQVNRFTGHAIRPYSVAEHSLLVCEIAEREHGLDVHGLLYALMHDAHEAYCGDLNSPAKRVIGDPWRRFEWRFEEAVLRAFALTGTSHAHASAVRQADLQALATERRDLMPDSARPWRVLQGVEPIGWVRLHSPERTAMDWEDWRDRWLDRYHELDFARNDRVFTPAQEPTA